MGNGRRARILRVLRPNRKQCREQGQSFRSQENGLLNSGWGLKFEAFRLAVGRAVRSLETELWEALAVRGSGWL